MSIDGRGIDMVALALTDLDPEVFTIVLDRLTSTVSVGGISRLGAYVRDEIERHDQERRALTSNALVSNLRRLAETCQQIQVMEALEEAAERIETLDAELERSRSQHIADLATRPWRN